MMRTGWVVLAAMCAAIVMIVVAPCGLRMSALAADHCPAPPPPAPVAADITASLLDRIAGAELALARSAQMCVAQPAPPPPVLPQSLPDWVDRRLVGGNLGFWIGGASGSYDGARSIGWAGLYPSVTCAPVAVGTNYVVIEGRRMNQTLMSNLGFYRSDQTPEHGAPDGIWMQQFATPGDTGVLERLSSVLITESVKDHYLVQSRLPAIERCTVELFGNGKFSGHVDLVVTYARTSAVRRAFFTLGSTLPRWDDPEGNARLPYMDINLKGGVLTVQPSASRRVQLPKGTYPE